MVYMFFFQHLYIKYNDQIRVIGTSITSNIYNFFVLGIFKISLHYFSKKISSFEQSL